MRQHVPRYRLDVTEAAVHRIERTLTEEDDAFLRRVSERSFQVIGLHGDDHIVTGLGHDILIGGAGSDRLVSGSGNDTLIGNGGIDVL